MNTLLAGLRIGIRIRPQSELWWLRPIIGIAIIVVILIVSIKLWKDLGQRELSDTSKTLWAISFFFLPIVSWIAYHYVVKEGKKSTKSSKQ